MNQKTTLTLNAGSSSLKFAVFGREVLAGGYERVGTPEAQFKCDGMTQAILPSHGQKADHATCMRHLVEFLESRNCRIELVGHRVVHGGDKFSAPVLITEETLAELTALTNLAPLHQPFNLLGVQAASLAFPGVPQVACFDTAFHTTQPAINQKFAIPRELTDAGIKAYGFHGLSYTYVAGQIPELTGKQTYKAVVCHLGSGASLCAIENGRSVASTMGFTALDGLMMGTRCGTLDAGVVLHLIQSMGYTPADVQDLLYKKSGLLGVSGISNDMRDIEVAMKAGDARATEAFDIFVNRVCQNIARLAQTMSGIDTLVFTAGIGEHSALVRDTVRARMEWLLASNNVRILVIPTNEELVIAEGARAVASQMQ